MRDCEWLRYRRLRARVMATYIRRRSSSRPSRSFMEFSWGNRPSSIPVMNTQSNSRPLLECTVISWMASWPACAWLSPDSSAAWVRKAASGATAPSAGLNLGLVRNMGGVYVLAALARFLETNADGIGTEVMAQSLQQRRPRGLLQVHEEVARAHGATGVVHDGAVRRRNPPRLNVIVYRS